MKFFIKDFFSKYDQTRSFLRIWSHLLKKFLIKNFIFCTVKVLSMFYQYANEFLVIGVEFRRIFTDFDCCECLYHNMKTEIIFFEGLEILLQSKKIIIYRIKFSQIFRYTCFENICHGFIFFPTLILQEGYDLHCLGYFLRKAAILLKEERFKFNSTCFFCSLHP